MDEEKRTEEQENAQEVQAAIEQAARILMDEMTFGDFYRIFVTIEDEDAQVKIMDDITHRILNRDTPEEVKTILDTQEGRAAVVNEFASIVKRLAEATILEANKERAAAIRAETGDLMSTRLNTLFDILIPKTTQNPAHKADYPLDRPNSKIWDDLKIAKNEINGQQRMAITGGEKHPETYFLYAVDFSKLNGTQLSQSLTPFDKRCMIAADAIRKAGNEITTATQIFRMMGNKKTPNGDDLQKVNDSLDKMMLTKICIDNEPEVSVRSDKPRFKYEGVLLPHERLTASVNGKITESAIHFLRESPLMEFARGRKEFTTIPRNLLETPLRKNDANIRLEGYFIETISHMKNHASSPRKMLYSTIFEKCSIKTPMQKHRAPDTIMRLLEHYVACKWISGYTPEEDGISIILGK